MMSGHLGQWCSFIICVRILSRHLEAHHSAARIFQPWEQFPSRSWLPKVEAPEYPQAPYLHSTTYLLTKIQPPLPLQKNSHLGKTPEAND